MIPNEGVRFALLESFRFSHASPLITKLHGEEMPIPGHIPSECEVHALFVHKFQNYVEFQIPEFQFVFRKRAHKQEENSEPPQKSGMESSLFTDFEMGQKSGISILFYFKSAFHWNCTKHGSISLLNQIWDVVKKNKKYKVQTVVSSRK